jgi:Tfp pilus assembly protein PilX
MNIFSRSNLGARLPARRGSVLITALIFSIVIAIALVSTLQLSTHSLRSAHRTFFADSAGNLAETGLEEAVWSFNTLANATDATSVANAWSGWTRGNTIGDIYMASMGYGYTSAPTVTISGGGGSGATAVATITTVYNIVDHVTETVTGVSAVTLTNPGHGYTSIPTITLSGGGGSGAEAVARLSATRVMTFPNFDQNATATAKVWVAGYDGTTNVPIIVAKATIQPYSGASIDKYIKVILSKNGLLPKGVVAKTGITWNGHPFADSFISSTNPGYPPFSAYNNHTARSNTTVASLTGTISLGAQGTVDGNVMTGPGVTVTGGTITGQTIGNFYANFNLPTYPTYQAATTGYIDLGTSGSLPAVLPRPADVAAGPAADGNYYYFVNGATIGATTITTNTKVVIVGSNTQMSSGLEVAQGSTTVGGVTTYTCGSCTIYMDGPITLSGNDQVNQVSSGGSWAGALKIYTNTTSDCSLSGNAAFCGCLTAPNAALVGNGSGNSQNDLSGSFVVRSVTSNGHMNFHYDEALNNLTSGKPWTLGLWTELQTVADRALYDSKFTTF